MGDTCYHQLLSTLIEYETSEVVRIKNSQVVGFINRLVQLAILFYILVWALIIQKGYQVRERGVSAVSTQVHGVSYPYNVTGDTRPVWDSIDTLVPAEENKAFFVTTSAVVASNQTLSICAEDASLSSCSTDEECQPVGTVIPQGHGVTNGTCNTLTGTCFIEGWCPLAHSGSKILLEGADNFTVLVKSHVVFSEYKTRASNVANLDSDYVNDCRYSPISDPDCPVFKLSDMVSEALAGTSYTFNELISVGAVIAVRIEWNCNLDYDVKDCFPTYKFLWLDNRAEQDFVTGYNYESAHYYNNADTAYRKFIKRYGLLFIMQTDAEAGKFEIFTTVLKIGSGLGLLTASTFICDLLILYVHKKKRLYYKYKYKELEGPDAFDSSPTINLAEPIGFYDGL